MTSKYALVQFYPDPVSDERLDVGVIAWDAAGAHVLFIESWERLDTIGLEDVRLLQDYAESIKERLSEGGGSHLDRETGDLAEDLIGDPGPRIRLTPAQSVAQDAPTLISSLAAKFHYSPHRVKRARDRRVAASHAFRAIVSATRGRKSTQFRRLVHARRMIEGKFAEHELDVVLEGDGPFAAVSGLSFEVKSRRRLREEVDATAWVFDDVLRLRPRMPLAVFALPATDPEGEAIQSAAAKVFQGLGARMIAEESTVARWALRHIRASRPILADSNARPPSRRRA